MCDDKHKGNPLKDRFDEKQCEACEVLDVIEENAWSLCGDIRDFRLRLSMLESLREKISIAD